MAWLKSVCKSQISIYILLFLFCIFLASCCQDYDYDLYARFIVGENFFDKGVFNYQDYLSYTPTHLWYDHEYGASLVFYLFFKLFGAFGLVLIQALLLFFTSFFIIKTQQIQKHAYPVSILFMGAFLLLYAHQNPSLVRCHMFSFVFYSMFLYFLEKTRIGYLKNKPSRILWLVPAIVIIWNNIHGGIVAGIGMIAIYMFGALVSKQNWQQYFRVLIVSTPLLIINPYGADYLNFLFSANTKSRVMITEWWHAFTLRHVRYYYPLTFTGVFGFLLVISNFITKKKINIIKAFALLVTLYLGIAHIKLLSLPIITLFALYYNEIRYIFSSKLYKILEKICLLVMILSIFCIPLKHPCALRTDIYKFPVKEVEFLKINGIKGNVLTEFGLGSYVAYKLYPDNLIYMDGRYEEVYYDREFDNLMNFEKVENDWLAVFRDYPTEILMIEKNVPVYKKLDTLAEWKKIYEGNLCGIFVPKNKVKRHYIMPSDDIEYYRSNEFTNKGFFKKRDKDK